MKKNNKGFTLAELLIVVAIIAVLVAISIPIFTTQLEKSREAVDISNMRAAYAIAETDIITEGYKDTNAYTESSGSYVGYYDLATSSMVKAKPTTGYGKASVDGNQVKDPDFPANATFTFDGNVEDEVIKVTLEKQTDGSYKATLEWA